MDSVTAEDVDLTIEDVLDAFADAEHALPRAELQWALDHWDIAGPRFVALIDAAVGPAEISPRTSEILFFALHLCGHRQETAAFQGLCRLMRHPTNVGTIMDEAIADTFVSIVISTFDGDADALKSVVEAPDVDAFVRDGALTALAYLVQAGRVPALDMRAWLLHLLHTMEPLVGGAFWWCWGRMIAVLGYTDLVQHVKDAFDRGLIERWHMTWDDFSEELQCTLDDPTPLAAFERHHVMPSLDVFDELSEWYSTPKPRPERSANAAAIAPVDTPPAPIPVPPPAAPLAVRNPYPNVGRNDPCPCGSGRKYKKCCLP